MQQVSGPIDQAIPPVRLIRVKAKPIAAIDYLKV